MKYAWDTIFWGLQGRATAEDMGQGSVQGRPHRVLLSYTSDYKEPACSRPILLPRTTIWGRQRTKTHLFEGAAAAAAAKSLQSCPTLCDPIDGSPPGSPVPGTRELQRQPGLGRPRLEREGKFTEVILTKPDILSSFYCDACSSSSVVGAEMPKVSRKWLWGGWKVKYSYYS